MMVGPRRKPGLMGPFVEGFRAWLFESSYTPATVHNMLTVAGQLGRWLASEGLEVADLDAGSIEAFRSARRRAGFVRVPTVGALVPLLRYLMSEGAVPVEPRAPLTPVEELMVGYHEWLVIERGLADRTVRRYEHLAHRFLRERAVVAGDCFATDLTGLDVIAFLVRESGRLNVGAAKGCVGELRSLLKFLYVKGFTTLALATVVPQVAGWHDTSVPNGLARSDVDRLLNSCDRNTSGGVRDHVVLLLVARLGLRSIEVARLELGDIDWRAGEIVIRGKARRRDRLPLPCDVGEALSTYLCYWRPSTTARELFLTISAPRRPIASGVVSDITHRACERAGVRKVGAHRLRHGLATEMLRAGATLTEVSQVLRHRDLATTAIYAKVDLDTLRRVAAPWPGAPR
jgi:site-specific recombinase XerD